MTTWPTYTNTNPTGIPWYPNFYWANMPKQSFWQLKHMMLSYIRSGKSQHIWHVDRWSGKVHVIWQFSHLPWQFVCVCVWHLSGHAFKIIQTSNIYSWHLFQHLLRHVSCQYLFKHLVWHVCHDMSRTFQRSTFLPLWSFDTEIDNSIHFSQFIAQISDPSNFPEFDLFSLGYPSSTENRICSLWCDTSWSENLRKKAANIRKKVQKPANSKTCKFKNRSKSNWQWERNETPRAFFFAKEQFFANERKSTARAK